MLSHVRHRSLWSQGQNAPIFDPYADRNDEIWLTLASDLSGSHISAKIWQFWVGHSTILESRAGPDARFRQSLLHIGLTLHDGFPFSDTSPKLTPTVKET